MASSNEGAAESIKCRLVLQQCLSARLQVRPATDEGDAEFVEINRGLVIYVCFMKDASGQLVDKLAKQALEVKLSRTDCGKLASVLDLPGDVLIVPQATLGGKLKGKMMQYHQNIEKETGQSLYNSFVERCKTLMGQHSASTEKSCQIKWGTYGNLQVLQLDTNGPFSHIIEG